MFFFFLSACFLDSANSFLLILLFCLLFSEFLYVCPMVFLNRGDYFIKFKRFVVNYFYHNIHVPMKFSNVYSLSVNDFFSFSTFFSHIFFTSCLCRFTFYCSSMSKLDFPELIIWRTFLFEVVESRVNLKAFQPKDSLFLLLHRQINPSVSCVIPSHLFWTRLGTAGLLLPALLTQPVPTIAKQRFTFCTSGKALTFKWRLLILSEIYECWVLSSVYSFFFFPSQAASVAA